MTDLLLALSRLYLTCLAGFVMFIVYLAFGFVIGYIISRRAP